MNDLVASLAHDLNNKMTLIGLQIGKFEKVMDNGSTWEEGKKIIVKLKSVLEDVVQMLQDSVNDNLESEVDVKMKITEICQSYEKEILNIQIEAYGNPKIKINKQKFSRLVTNIIQNSIDQKSKMLKIFIRDNSLIFHDNGGGVDQDTLLKINRGTKTSTKKGGKGLGLFSIYEFSKKMKWKFEIENRLNEDMFPKKMGIMVKFIFPTSLNDKS